MSTAWRAPHAALPTVALRPGPLRAAPLLLAAALLVVARPRASGAEPGPPRKGPTGTAARGKRDASRQAGYLADLARVHARYGQLDRAVETYGKAVELEADPQQRARLRLELADVLTRAGRANDAVKIMEEVAAALPQGLERVRCHLQLAQIYERKGQVEQAIGAYREVVAHSQGAWERRGAQQRLLALYAKTGRLADEIAKYEERFGANATDAEARDALIEVHSRLRPHPGKLLAVLEASSGAEPKSLPLRRRLASAYELAGQPDKALGVYTALATSDARNRAYYYERLSGIEAARGRPEAAMEWARRIVAEEPDSPAAQARYARICQTHQRHRAALEAYQKAATLAGTDRDRENYTLQAALAARAGKLNDQAETLLRKVQSAASSPQLRVQAKRYLFELLEEQGRLDEIKFKREGKPTTATPTSKEKQDE